METAATQLLVGPEGEISLPEPMRDRLGFRPKTAVRVIETKGGVLLVPLTGEPPSPELQQELDEWGALDAGAWDQFPFEDEET